MPSLSLQDINKSRFIKAEDCFKNNEVFVIVGFEGVKETVINNRSAKISEFRIRLMSDGELYTLSLGYNPRHDNVRDYFLNDPEGHSEPLKLGQMDTKKGNPAWIFVSGSLVEE